MNNLEVTPGAPECGTVHYAAVNKSASLPRWSRFVWATDLIVGAMIAFLYPSVGELDPSRDRGARVTQ